MLKPKTKKNLSLAIILIIVVYTLCFGFLSYHKFQEWVLFPFFESMISVFMGAGAIGLITGIILIFQSTIQSAQEKNKEVFDRKLNLYEKIINDMNGYFEDNKIDDDERRNLFFTQLSVALLSKPKTFNSFSDLLKNISDEEGNLNESAPDKLLNFILEAREDLDVQSEMTEEDNNNFGEALIMVREEAVKTLKGYGSKFSVEIGQHSHEELKTRMTEYLCVNTTDDEKVNRRKFKLRSFFEILLKEDRSFHRDEIKKKIVQDESWKSHFDQDWGPKNYKSDKGSIKTYEWYVGNYMSNLSKDFTRPSNDYLRQILNFESESSSYSKKSNAAKEGIVAGDKKVNYYVISEYRNLLIEILNKCTK